jgi:hypothetical protein
MVSGGDAVPRGGIEIGGDGRRGRKCPELAESRPAAEMEERGGGAVGGRSRCSLFDVEGLQISLVFFGLQILYPRSNAPLGPFSDSFRTSAKNQRGTTHVR